MKHKFSLLLKRNYFALLSILNLNLKDTYQEFVTKPVKKYMFCPELQVTCSWINEDFSCKRLWNVSLITAL